MSMFKPLWLVFKQKPQERMVVDQLVTGQINNVKENILDTFRSFKCYDFNNFQRREGQ